MCDIVGSVLSMINCIVHISENIPSIQFPFHFPFTIILFFLLVNSITVLLRKELLNPEFDRKHNVKLLCTGMEPSPKLYIEEIVVLPLYGIFFKLIGTVS